jgi:putative transposase
VGSKAERECRSICTIDRAEGFQDCGSTTFANGQLRNATMDGLAPRFLVRDRAEKFGATFDRVAEATGARVIKTAVRAPNMNPIGERFIGSLRREALDHVVLFGEEHLGKVAGQYAIHFNKVRPHQGIGQRIPDGPANDNDVGGGKIIATSVLGGLHRDYRRVR